MVVFFGSITRSLDLFLKFVKILLNFQSIPSGGTDWMGCNSRDIISLFLPLRRFFLTWFKISFVYKFQDSEEDLTKIEYFVGIAQTTSAMHVKCQIT